ncbi:AAA family ATPase [Sphingobium fuliginis]|jgi:energy-coupling factor transporter ATP-binding protein EcfA2|uniref:AAA family ATPase n=1 Tax=Sphingobium fuliginis (strain ATCC 27551) TaxID=336203 RepID=A0A7M2GHI9_SPHSA|nr:AAA family ATPase [Sphingobium fuliginis]QOT71855.1 AAA family ATPase [Sphingobium fuliginis]
MTTEAEALATILTWSADCAGWQSDALRRLATQGGVDAAGLEELVAICKGDSPAVPLEAAHLRDPNREQGEVYLRQVHGVRHVNALAPDQRLTLHRVGLTIIYGDNGSGKSGYARILKRACRARMSGRGEEIIPDIYEAQPGTPSANIEYAISGQNRTCAWQLGQPADTALSAVSVFDSRTANIHVDETNDVAYTPFPLKLLGSLAQLCKLIKDKLAAEITQLQAQTPQSIKAPTCSPLSKVGQLLARLAANTDPAAVEALATLTQAERDRLAQLTADLAGDPSRAARQLAALKTKVEGHIARLDRLIAAIGNDSAAALRRLATESDATRRAAEAASGALFAGEPLPYIGSEVWQSLWDSARAFSVEAAYPERNFPVTEPGSVCVLCQQELSPQAADRLNRFEAFVRDDSQLRADAARAAYDEAVAAFAESGLTLAELDAIVATIRDDLRQDALATEVRRAGLHALWRHRQISRRHANPAAVIGAELVALPRQALADQVADLEARGEGLVAEADSPARAALIAERTELADRQWLNGIKADVLAQIGRLKQIKAIETAQRDTTTNRITTKSTEIAQALVTDALRAQFAREVASFEIAGLAVELRQQNSVQGVPRFKVALTRKPTASVGQVLSEGEHRCVALAAFMAELATTENKSGIVFDDPVSSLDHMHREAVAKRLIAEAAIRQVIVFTHDLAFLFELDRAAKEVDPKPQVAVSSVSRGSDKAGFCRSEPPFKARRVADITASLTNQLANERFHFDQGDQDKWRDTVKSIAGSLRDTWEIAVEEAVGHVIRRLSNEVKTPGLVKLTAITVADCEAMRDGFQRCSELLHSAAPALNRPLPRPDALTDEINALTTWADNLRQRQNAARLP